MKLISTLLIILAIQFHLHASGENEPGTTENLMSAVVVTGKITDGDTGEALTGVKIEIEGTEVRSYTDFEGHYRLVVPSTSQIKMKYRYITYEPVDAELTDEAKRGNVTRDIILHRL